MAHMDTQLHSLDEIVTRVRAQNNAHHTAHTSSLGALSTTVQSSYSSIGDHLSTSFSRVQALESDVSAQTTVLMNTLPTLSENATIRAPLHELRSAIEQQNLKEYNPTGQTPQRFAYDIPSNLPRTESHEILLSRLRDRPISEDTNRSPSKGLVFNDATNSTNETSDDTTTNLFSTSTMSKPIFSRSISATSNTGLNAGASLRELDINTLSQDTGHAHTMPLAFPSDSAPPFKKQNRGLVDMESTKLPMKKIARKTVANLGASTDDRENLTITNFSASVGPGLAGGRRLRSHGSS